VAGAEVTFDIETSIADKPVFYRTGTEDAWTDWSVYTSGTAIPLKKVGDKVQFKGDNAGYGTLVELDSSIFSFTADCYVYGNIMSLVTSTEFSTCTTLTADYAFCFLFYENGHLLSHPSKRLFLPATTLAKNCYGYMFAECTGLEEAPELPATTLVDMCYYDMFYRCASLKEAPELPATTLAYRCYLQMFSGCVSLAVAPELPATTLAEQCYYSMFKGCSCLTNAPKLPATTLADSCYSEMFYGCASLTVAPELPATSLIAGCYFAMFAGCANLKSVTCLAVDISASGCTENWLNGVSSTGTFFAPKETDWTTGVSGIPSGWTREDL
jgi:hypothetical protein